MIEHKADMFTKTIDNDPEVASIDIPYSDNGVYDIRADEIKEIEIIE